MPTQRAVLPSPPSPSYPPNGIKDSNGSIIWADNKSVISGLTPDTDYTMVTKPEGAADVEVVKGCVIKTPGAPIDVTHVADSDNPAKDQLTFTVDSGKSYAVVDDDGNYYSANGAPITTGDPWTPGTGSAVTVTGLERSKTYAALVKDLNAPNAIPTAAVSKPNGDTTISDNAVSAKVEAAGTENADTASITVTPTTSGKRYVVVDKDNMVVATGIGNGDALTFSGDPITTDNIPGILPGQTYTVVMMDEGVSVNVGDHQTPSRGAQVTAPVAGENGITTREDLEHDGKYVVAIKLTNPGVDYVLVTPDGAQVAQQTGKENNGSVVFDNLDPNTTYHVVAVPNGGVLIGNSTAQTDMNGKLASLPGAPIRSGDYTFNGWYTVPSGGTQVTTNYVFSSDATVYAQWTYTGGYTGDGGSSGGSSPSRYQVSIESAVGGKVIASLTNASKGTSITLTVSADDGYELKSLTARDSSKNEIELMKSGASKYTFKIPLSKVIVTPECVRQVMPPEVNPTPTLVANPFTDVSPDAYYYNAVLWAVEKSITSGTTATTFNPDVSCTRAQMVTFLWRSGPLALRPRKPIAIRSRM